ncbi:hypothetical protein Cgig2_008930 [Carnegiea gigantea]|uniref:Expansin n=1 Tax=Carnegiea gigantea TaxID=171969 RepID=A0A9Q1GNJ5_9CARY|nr:hypothetical protein Cgig2_008930 [Carnegiea gigantea]
MAQVMGTCCVNWQIVLLLLVVLMVFEGVKGSQGKHWNRGHATFYGQNQSPATLGGACGYDSTVHAGFGIHTTALSAVLFRKGEACGACYQVRCDYRADSKWCLRAGQVTVTATNFCPANNQGGWCDLPRQHFDMAMPSFLRIARPGNEGIVPILFKRYTLENVYLSFFVLKSWLWSMAQKNTYFLNVVPSSWRFGQTFSARSQFTH